MNKDPNPAIPLTLIIPPGEFLLEDLKDFILFGYYKSYSAFIESSKILGGKAHQLKGIIIDNSGYPLSFLPLQKIPSGTPVYIYTGSIGDPSWLFENLDLLRSDCHILLPSGNPGSFTSVKFLASLGINCGIEFQDDRIDWDGVENVAGYIFTSEIPHGIIEPFTYLLENYNPREYLDFNIALLNTPLRFLYVDEELNIYPTRTAMLNNRKTGSGKEYLKNYPQTKEYRDLKFKWKDLFMSLNPCSTCPAFRICLGKFAGGDTDLVRCRSAFSKILEGIENYKQNQTGIRVNG